MNEFDDVSSDVFEPTEIDMCDSDDWSAFDSEVTDEFAEGDSSVPVDSSLSDEFLSEAEKAADYARSFGFDKAADYIERHYDGEDFEPGTPIPITTRNMTLDGTKSDNGVAFERRTAELVDGLSVEGVFPNFDSIHHVDLGVEANDMSIYQQFSACKEDFQEHMYDSPEKTKDITFGAMERMDIPQGYTPEGYTWQHNPETGSFDLVSKEEHSVGHTGGNAFWGNI